MRDPQDIPHAEWRAVALTAVRKWWPYAVYNGVIEDVASDVVLHLLKYPNHTSWFRAVGAVRKSWSGWFRGRVSMTRLQREIPLTETLCDYLDDPRQKVEPSCLDLLRAIRLALGEMSPSARPYFRQWMRSGFGASTQVIADALGATREITAYHLRNARQVIRDRIETEPDLAPLLKLMPEKYTYKPALIEVDRLAQQRRANRSHVERKAAIKAAGKDHPQ